MNNFKRQLERVCRIYRLPWPLPEAVFIFRLKLQNPLLTSPTFYLVFMSLVYLFFFLLRFHSRNWTTQFELKILKVQFLDCNRNSKALDAFGRMLTRFEAAQWTSCGCKSQPNSSSSLVRIEVWTWYLALLTDIRPMTLFVEVARELKQFFKL